MPSNRDATERDDHELLAEFLIGSESAFAELVRRHVDCVYTSAQWQVRDPHMAADVTSAVFVILARKAAGLDKRTVLPAWLHRTAHYAALKAVRARTRRQHYEQEAARMQDLLQTQETTGDWEEIAPLLDGGLTQLPAQDHEVLVLRFFQSKTFPEIALVVGSTEEGARKRVERAMEKLRQFLARRGVQVPAAGLTASLAVNSVQASPAALAGAISSASLTAPLPPLVLETLRAVRWQLWKPLAAGLAVMVVGSALLFSVVHTSSAGSPLRAFRLLSQAGRDGDAERWSSLVQAASTEEQQVRGFVASNVVAQAEPRRALIQRFGQAEYESSGFPRLLDDLPESRISSAIESITGNHAVVQLPGGSNLKFVLANGVWKFDFFRTTQARPIEIRNAMGNRLTILHQTKRLISEGNYRSLDEAQLAYQSRR